MSREGYEPPEIENPLPKDGHLAQCLLACRDALSAAYTHAENADEIPEIWNEAVLAEIDAAGDALDAVMEKYGLVTNDDGTLA